MENKKSDEDWVLISQMISKMRQQFIKDEIERQRKTQNFLLFLTIVIVLIVTAIIVINLKI